KISWAYNWANAAGGSLSSGVEYVPMMWGQKSQDGWSAAAKAAIAAGSTHLLGFNEPDLAEQANMDVATAVNLWKSVMEPLKGSAKLVSPAVTNGNQANPPVGIPWLQQFIAQCTGCQIDAVAVRSYDAASNTAYFKSYFSQAATTLNKPIWITEASYLTRFMGTGSAADQATFVKDVVPWLEQQSFIERYAAFGEF
ncbi:hypothetical protein T439DRAFT_279891, partial [Meredithblackwellia eburnea MCA 4105]